VIFPAHASTLSAWGILWSDIAHDLSITRIGLFSEVAPQLAERTTALLAEADRLLAEDGVPAAARRYEWAVDLRYAGQAFDLRVPLDEADFSPEGVARATEAFHAVHRQRFSYDEPEVPVEIVALRLTAIGGLAKPGLAPAGAAAAGKAPDSRLVHGRNGPVPTPVWEREAIGQAPIAGPVIVEEAYTSVYLPAGWRIFAHASGALIADRLSTH
jgi:N-methylhydantoinase A